MAILQPAQPEQLAAPQEPFPLFLLLMRALIHKIINSITASTIPRSAMLMPFMLLDLDFLSQFFAFFILLEEQHVDHTGKNDQSSDQA